MKIVRKKKKTNLFEIHSLKCSVIWCSKHSWWNLWPQGNKKNGFTNKYPEQIAHSSCPSMTMDRFRNVCNSFRTRCADLADSSMSIRCSWIFALYSYKKYDQNKTSELYRISKISNWKCIELTLSASQLTSLKWSIFWKSSKNGNRSSILNKSHSLSNSNAGLTSFLPLISCSAINNQSFRCNSRSPGCDAVCCANFGSNVNANSTAGCHNSNKHWRNTHALLALCSSQTLWKNNFVIPLKWISSTEVIFNNMRPPQRIMNIIMHQRDVFSL